MAEAGLAKITPFVAGIRRLAMGVTFRVFMEVDIVAYRDVA